MKISVIIPVYKNKELFLGNLEANYSFIKDHEIIIVDDASKENIAEEVKKKYPKIIVLTNEKNVGFAPTVNRGAEKSIGDILILLNSDVKLLKKLEELTEPFNKDDNLFAISFAQIEKDASIAGKNNIFFRDGFVQHSRASDTKSGLNAWAEGGSSAIRATFFKKLGGFRDIYAPFYWEDIDLSYRAYGSGWHVLFDENYKVEHHHESTIGRYFSKNFVKSIAYRNQLFFIWTNIKDGNLLIQHALALPIFFLRTFLRGDFAFVRAFIAVLIRVFEVLKIRRLNVKYWYVKDANIFDKLKNN